ncbi:hypothetical protein J2847_006472 [Azospirillum agricola]|uniref:AbiU2 domain-containing protein n=1 Tax=Azospirillum agricola TaxID=1720247 RepID=UPI001AE729B4|nr:hypothetical protein [Azospirillum agricola]MBP2233137.1 hypothetical protein [Azospirillum agricola]
MTDVRDLQKHIEAEVQAMSSSFYAWKAINELAASDRRLQRGLQGNALTWNIVLHSLQLTFFIALGRLFDTDSDALSLSRFLKDCEKALPDFSRNALEQRKVRDNGGQRPAYLDDWMVGKEDATAAHFRALKSAVKQCRKVYEAGQYNAIRNQVMAHRDVNALDQQAALFAKTNVGDVLDLITRLHQVLLSVFDLYENGRWVDPSQRQPATSEQRFNDDVQALLSKLAPPADDVDDGGAMQVD